jgi:hypothetical protein
MRMNALVDVAEFSRTGAQVTRGSGAITARCVLPALPWRLRVVIHRLV